MNRRQLITALASLPFVRHFVSAPPVQAEPETFTTVDVAYDPAVYSFGPTCLGDGVREEISPGIVRCVYRSTSTDASTFTASMTFIP
jgi:hypothetical protein